MSVIVVWDDNFVEHELDGATVEDVLDRVRELDGESRSLVTVLVGDAHLAVGGRSPKGIVLYVSFDGLSFDQLTRGVSDDDPVQVVAGGQAAAYDSRFVVDLTLAERAVQQFVDDGVLAHDLDWERS
jgi:hypothetical protein